MLHLLLQLAVQLVATSTSEPLSNDYEKLNQPKRFFFSKCNGDKISVKRAFSLATLSEVVFINQKGDCSGKTVGFCKHKSSSLFN